MMDETIKKLLVSGKGILAADESDTTANKRLGEVGVESTAETRRQYRDLFLSTPGIGQYLSGVILYDETIRQNGDDGRTFVEILNQEGVVSGIKVDQGLVENKKYPGETITNGLDGLPERLKEYYELGARFAKWRSAFRIGERTPTEGAIAADAMRMSEYVKLCYRAEIVPIVEPEVLLNGVHNIEQSEVVTTKVLKLVFEILQEQEVDLTRLILKSSMVVSGDMSGEEVTPQEVAERTVRALKAAVPEIVPGVVFLSGGQNSEEATMNLDALAKLEPLPWPIAFSFARAIQRPVLEVWRGEPAKVSVARELFMAILKREALADRGALS